MRVYVSGRIKNRPEHRDDFARGCKLIEDAGNVAVSPLDCGEEWFSYEQFMVADLKALLGCDAILMLDGWEKSAGARCEHHVAAMCGLKVHYEVIG